MDRSSVPAFLITREKVAAAMPYDEYEISIGREISLCRRMIGSLERALQGREERHGMTTEVFLQLSPSAPPSKQQKDFQQWSEDLRELQVWQRRLGEYEEALQMVKHL
ncbi:MAG TPA: hypothetical protein DCZ69_07840 [Syntrophobacteraceae bacterium]|nr:hypothetical protein [Syntrophobacteraceae bacterium]